MKKQRPRGYVKAHSIVHFLVHLSEPSIQHLPPKGTALLTGSSQVWRSVSLWSRMLNPGLTPRKSHFCLFVFWCIQYYKKIWLIYLLKILPAICLLILETKYSDNNLIFTVTLGSNYYYYNYYTYEKTTQGHWASK